MPWKVVNTMIDMLQHGRAVDKGAPLAQRWAALPHLVRQIVDAPEHLASIADRRGRPPAQELSALQATNPGAKCTLAILHP